MRMIRRLLLLAIVAVGGVAAFNYFSENGWPARPGAAALEASAKQQAERIATRAAATARDAADRLGDRASNAAGKLGDSVDDGALTAKIKSKMALDDHVQARDINVDTSNAIVTLTGVVASTDQRDRALRLARDTDGVTRVVDRLQVQRP
jgi:osmotically-inducible protein OsmY